MDEIVKTERIAGYLEVWLGSIFPFAKMKVKVLERSSDFLAVPNLIFRNPSTGDPEYVSGLGDTSDEAIHDLLERFVADVKRLKPEGDLAESDFEWSAPEDF
jgi:hypothetical protein